MSENIAKKWEKAKNSPKRAELNTIVEKLQSILEQINDKVDEDSAWQRKKEQDTEYDGSKVFHNPLSQGENGLEAYFIWQKNLNAFILQLISTEEKKLFAIRNSTKDGFYHWVKSTDENAILLYLNDHEYDNKRGNPISARGYGATGSMGPVPVDAQVREYGKLQGLLEKFIKILDDTEIVKNDN